MTPQNNNLDNELFSERDIVDLEHVKKIRHAISSWSNSIKHHNIVNLGEKIAIVSIKEKPAYCLKMQTQCEFRELVSQQGIYNNKESYGKGLDASDIDVWEFKPGIDYGDFKETKEPRNHIIKDSKKVVECGACRAKGNLTCSTCNGSGKTSCFKCSGRGKEDSGERCTSCNGRGNKTCSVNDMIK